MSNDLPDYQSQVSGVGLEATSFLSGLDSDKPASPAAGDIWLARDTGILYVCNVAGAWTNIGILYLLKAGGTMSGAIAMGTNKITGLAAPAADGDAARKLDVDTVDAKLVNAVVAYPTRAVNTTYQNGAKLRFISPIVKSGETNTSNWVIVTGKHDVGASPSSIIGQASSTHYHASLSLEAKVCLGLWIPANYYYRVEATASGTPATLSGVWAEWDFF